MFKSGRLGLQQGVSRVTRSIDEARALLGVAADTSPTAVAQAYRRLARLTHPDVSSDADAAQRFAAVCAAYELLQQVPVRPAPGPEPDPTAPDPVVDPRVRRADAVPRVPPRVAARLSGSPLNGAGYFGRPVPVIVAGPVTVRPTDPTTRRPGRKGDR
jgi:hypothetical protein